MTILKKKRRIQFNIILSMLVLIIVLVMIIMSIFLVRNKMLQNAQNLGMALAESYAKEEEGNIDSFKNILEIGSQYVDQLYSPGKNQDIQKWLQDYFQKTNNMFGEGVIDSYAVIDGEIIAVNPWEGDDDYNYKDTEWYQQAIKADGEIIFTDVYKDAITSQYIVTAAKALNNPGDVIVMDIYYRNMDINNTLSDVSDDCSIYLCDGNGNLINAMTKWQFSEKEKEESLKYLLEGIQDGSLIAYDSYFTDFDGKNRGVYYAEMSNGWLLILTIPFESVLMGEKNIPIYILCGVGILLFIFLLAEVIREILMSKAMAKADNTIRILSDSFYAIYRVNYKTGIYEAIKMSTAESRITSKTGEYTELLENMKKYVKSEDFDEFEESFSLGSIRKRVQDGIFDYGGDYKRNFDGVYKWVNIRTLYNKELAKEEVILCFREIDAEKQQQQQHILLLKETLDMLKESTRAKEKFFNNMSHDMRTPLNAIIGFSNLVRNHIDEKEKVKDYMAKIQHAGQHLLGLINDILELSRAQSKESSVKTEPFNLRECIQKSAGLFEEQIERENKSIHVQVDIQDEIVVGDAFKLEQILNNLISNAVKYSNPGDSVTVSVTQQPYPELSRYQIVISDTGIGMSEDFIKHIFEPYAREMHFTRENVVGTGLGMFIVKSLVQQMNGEISIKSCLGEGSEVTLVFPMATAGRIDAEQKTEKLSGDKEYTLSGRRVLLVEDNALNMEIASEILHMNGVQVVSAENGAEAVKIFQESQLFWFDAVLMDMQMPVMDGCEATKHIRALEREDAGRVPIIAVTANTFSEDMDRTFAAGMNGHISKPVDFKALTDLLKTLMEERDNTEKNGAGC